MNTSGKKRTLSETLEDELLGGTSTEATNNDDDDVEREVKRRHHCHASDAENNEVSIQIVLNAFFPLN